MCIAAFCRRRRVNHERLRYWQRVLADRGAKRSGFVEIRPSRRRGAAAAPVAQAAALLKDTRLPVIVNKVTFTNLGTDGNGAVPSLPGITLSGMINELEKETQGAMK